MAESSSHGGGQTGGSRGGGSGGQSGGAGAGAGGGGSGGPSNPANAAMFAERQRITELVMTTYAASLCGLIGVFVLFHWTRRLCTKLERSRSSSGASFLGRPFVLSTRLVRNVLIRKVPGFKSAGHALLVAVYVAINLSLSFTRVDATSMSTLGSRFGWMAIGNLCFVIFLALKNTPLAFLTAYSYERLNCLHQIAGYTTFTYIVLHASLYTAYFGGMGRLTTKYAESTMIAAIVAAFSVLSAVFSSTFLRRWWYELFYVVHIMSWMTAIVAIGFHQPKWTKRAIVAVLLASSAWITDRLIRASRVLYYSFNNEATLHALPNGGTKIVMKKVPARAEAGKHCFVWIPAVRRFETHPFTIHRTNPVEFTVKAHNGFTSDLHKYALANPGKAVRASIDGPYGTFPDPMEFDKIVLIAGGGGATFTFGLAVNVLERMRDEAPKNVVFIWAVKKHENLAWFKDQLALLKTHAHSPTVNVSLYVTRTPESHSHLPHLHRNNSVAGQSHSSESSDGPSPPISPVSGDEEKNLPPRIPASARHAGLSEKDLEKEMERVIETRVEHPSATKPLTTATGISHEHEHPVKAGRPDVGTLIRNAVSTTPPNQRVLVAACGPDGLMRVVRDTTAKLIRGDGPAVELHCEQFGW